MAEPAEMFAWFSGEAVPVTGIVECLGVDGRPVQCIGVSETEDHGYRWKDIVCVGKVRGFLRRVSDGSTQSPLFYRRHK